MQHQFEEKNEKYGGSKNEGGWKSQISSRKCDRRTMKLDVGYWKNN